VRRPRPGTVITGDQAISLFDLSISDVVHSR
jgi:hypothetical protein